jgi:hypothetical protein
MGNGEFHKDASPREFADHALKKINEGPKGQKGIHLTGY